MRTALLFAGQGVDLAALAQEWRDASSRVRELLDVASDATGVPVRRMLHASGTALRATETYQPVMTALGAGVLHELAAAGVGCDVVAGHSLGEVTALVAAGALDAESAVRLAAVRGRLMAREAALHPGCMAAITAHVEDEALDAVQWASGRGRAQVAAHNAADEWVLSGDAAAMHAIPARYAPAMLATGGPWHSVAMQGAVGEYRAALRSSIGRPTVPIIANRHGRLVRPDENLVELVAGQLLRAVEWHATMQTLRAMNPEMIVTVGPARPVASLARRALGTGAPVVTTERPHDLDALVRVGAA